MTFRSRLCCTGVHSLATSRLGVLGGDNREQGIDFHIIQPLECSGQILRQEMALLRRQNVRSGFASWDSRRPAAVTIGLRSPGRNLGDTIGCDCVVRHGRG